MTQWYVKDLSKLTGVSVQTLHHYDRIDLLKPSVRQPNGYRLYSERDLLQLQQIIALKFLGFELSKIKALLTDDAGALEHFEVQATLLEQKGNALLDASKALNSIISDVADDKSIPWKSIIEIIEVYRMTQQLENSWLKDIFTPNELKEYATFEAELKANATPDQQAAFEKSWADLVAEINRNIKSDPKSDTGIKLGKKCMVWINGVYGKKYAHLRTKKFEQGHIKGKGLDEIGLTPEAVQWMDKAIDAYWKDRIYSILGQVGSEPETKILTLWQKLLEDMFGDDTTHQDTIYDATLADSNVSEIAKQWLKTIRH